MRKKAQELVLKPKALSFSLSVRQKTKEFVLILQRNLWMMVVLWQLFSDSALQDYNGEFTLPELLGNLTGKWSWKLIWPRLQSYSLLTELRLHGLLKEFSQVVLSSHSVYCSHAYQCQGQSHDPTSGVKTKYLLDPLSSKVQRYLLTGTWRYFFHFHLALKLGLVFKYLRTFNKKKNFNKMFRNPIWK